MTNTMIGKKLHMTQLFQEDGSCVPVTVLEVGPCPVVQLKSAKQDGYMAIQIGFDQLKQKKMTKPQAGHLKNIETKPRFLREVRLADVADVEKFKVGQIFTVGEWFQTSEKVDVTGLSKGHGFQGVVKRWGFKGGPKTHGQSDRLRAPGSIGSGTTPGRVIKGMKMAGRMGNSKVTVSGLRVIQIDTQKNLMYVKGAVPGARNSLVMVRKSRS